MASRPRTILVAGLCAVTISFTACASAPPRSGLVKKLERHNSLTPAQANCVADGLYDGMPKAQPPTRRLTSAELRAVAKPDNAGKVSAPVIQIMRSVVAACVPATTAPGGH